MECSILTILSVVFCYASGFASFYVSGGLVGNNRKDVLGWVVLVLGIACLAAGLKISYF